MATLAHIFDRFNTRAMEELEQLEPDRGEAFRLRMFPNEDVYFFVKRIDNSRVVREADPQTRRACWRLIGTCCALAVFLTGALLPSVQGLLAGYRIQALRQEQQRLGMDRAKLELQETELLTTDRLQKLADLQRFVDPTTPQKYIYLDGKPEGALAQVNQPVAALPVAAKE